MNKQLFLGGLALAVAAAVGLGFLQSPAQVTAQQSPLGTSPQLAIVGDAQAITLTCQDDTRMTIQVIDSVRALVSCQAGSLTVLDPSMVIGEPPVIASPGDGAGRSAVPVGDLALPTQEPVLMPTVTPTRWEPY